MNLDFHAQTLETLQSARSRLLHTHPQPPPTSMISPKHRPASARRALHSAGTSPENLSRQRPHSAKGRDGDGVLPVDLSKDLGTDMAWQRVSQWLKVLAHNEGMDQTSFLRSTTSSFLATSYPGISHSRPVLHTATPPKVVQRHTQQQQEAKLSTLELQAAQAQKISKLEIETAKLRDEVDRLRLTEGGLSLDDSPSMRAVFQEQLSKSKRTCEALMKDKTQLLKQLSTAEESRNALAAAVEGYKVQIAQLNRKIELDSQRVLSSPAGKSQAATDAKIAEANDANSHLLLQMKQLQSRLDAQQQQLQLDAQQKQTIQADAAAAVTAAERQNDALRLQNEKLQLQIQQLQQMSIANMAAAPSDAPLAVLNSELMQLVETRGAAIAALQSEMSATIEASLGSKAADIISQERKRIEPHVTSLVQAVRTSEGRVQLLQEQLKESQNQLVQLQHSVMITNITQSQGSKRPSSASSRPSSASSRGFPAPESEAAVRLIQGQADSLKMQMRELEGETQQLRQELLSKRASIDHLSAQLDAARREASDSQALVASLKAMASGGANAVSSATENATLKQELSRCQDEVKRLMNQETANAQTISSFQSELEAKMDQIDELKGQIMTALLKNREVSLEVEAAQSELRDKEQELRRMQNYLASLQAAGEDGGGESGYLMAEAERLRAEVDYSNERRMESEYKVAELQNRVEEVELELNSVRAEHQQSQQELQKLLADQEETIEQRCREVQTRLEEVLVELESTKVELVSSEEECALALNNMALLLKKSNRIAEALPLYTRALELRQKALGDDHIELTPVMVNIGALHFMDGNFSDASAIFEQALEIRKRELGVDHSQTISTQQWLTKCLGKLQDGEGDEGV